MAHDQLAKFRNIAKSASVEQPEGDPRHYAAFATSAKPVERLEIRSLTAETHAPSYRYLMDVSYDGSYGTKLILFYSFMMVQIEGQHLKEVIAHILDGTCLYIQDFDAREYDLPQNANTPVINTIKITTSKDVEQAKEEGRAPGVGRGVEIDKGRSAGIGR